MLVVVFILITAIATVVGATFPQTLVDDYITPMLASGSKDFSGLASDLFRLALYHGNWCYYSFWHITELWLMSVREPCRHLERTTCSAVWRQLPIKYFDTHAHGDIMSVYTNDVDTLRQLLSQSIPQIINAVITMTATLITMILLINPFLTILSIITAFVMLTVTKNFSSISGRYYVQQQIDLGKVDGFIEEMLGWTESCKSLLP